MISNYVSQIEMNSGDVDKSQKLLDYINSLFASNSLEDFSMEAIYKKLALSETGGQELQEKLQEKFTKVVKVIRKA